VRYSIGEIVQGKDSKWFALELKNGIAAPFNRGQEERSEADDLPGVLCVSNPAAGVFVVSLVSSPGSGRPCFGKTLTLLRQHYRVARACRRSRLPKRCHPIGRSRAPVKQITTGTLCHLEAAMVENALQEWGSQPT